ncbi:MAG: hypothetical protein U5R31_02395 [Acidimicrobiia bacterium]|nr:hypothetical protein [Acidimicrobiia bacterium]
MTLAALRGDFVYDLFLFLHILTAIIGFGATFVWPMLASRSRSLPPSESYAVNHLSLGLARMFEYFIYAVGVTGIVLILVSDFIEFSEAWISIALGLYIIGLACRSGLHLPEPQGHGHDPGTSGHRRGAAARLGRTAARGGRARGAREEGRHVRWHPARDLRRHPPRHGVPADLLKSRVRVPRCRDRSIVGR